MHKYLQLFSISWSSQLVYRVNVFFWRFRQFLSTLMTLTVWQVVYAGTDQVSQYNQSDMFAYIFVVSALQSLILATTLHGLAGYVWNGTLSNELLKPVNTYLYLAVQDIADKLRNISFVIGESALLFLLFKPTLTIPTLEVAALFGVWVILGAVIYFWIGLLFGAIGFYSPQTWGPLFLFFIMLDFTAGKLYPLDILPLFMQKVLYYTPFPYLSFVQTQLFLGRIPSSEYLRTTGILLALCIILGFAAIGVWRRSLKEYGAVGH